MANSHTLRCAPASSANWTLTSAKSTCAWRPAGDARGGVHCTAGATDAHLGLAHTVSRPLLRFGAVQLSCYPHTVDREPPASQSQAVPTTAARYRIYWVMEPIDRITLVKTGVPLELHRRLACDLHVSRAQLSRWLGFSPNAIARKARLGRPLGRVEGERLLGLARLVGEVEQILFESGSPTDFDAARWMSGWLVQPQSRLHGLPPIAYIDIADGRTLLSTLLRQMQSGVYV